MVPNSAWSAEIPLVGAGGEVVDLRRTLLSHGFVELPSMSLDEDVPALELTLVVNGNARTVEIRPGRRGSARVGVLGRAPSARTAEELVASVQHVLALDEDLSGLRARCQGSRAVLGCGRRGPDDPCGQRI